MNRALIAVLLFVTAVAAADESYDRARALALSGKRTEAVVMLRSHLEAHPDDYDSRILLGTVLSWDSHLVEARAGLERVLTSSHENSDALLALANVALWSGHPDEALALTERAIAAAPLRNDARVSRARILSRLDRPTEALAELDTTLRLDRNNEDALVLRRRIEGTRPKRSVTLGGSTDHFNQDRSPWKEGFLGISVPTRRGNVIGRVSHAERFSTSDDNLDLEAYPSLGGGTYAWVSLGVSPQHRLYPRWRLGGDLYHSLGHGWEASLGYRRLRFNQPVDIWVGSLSKYSGDWLFSGRVTEVPDSTVGHSTGYQVLARRYNGDGRQYFGIRAGRGTSREEIRSSGDVSALSSSTVGIEGSRMLTGRLGLRVRADYGEQQRQSRASLNQLTGSLSLNYDF